MADAGASYRNELDKFEPHGGRLTQRRRELISAIEGFIEASRKLDDYGDADFRAARSVYQSLGWKIIQQFGGSGDD